MKNMQLKDILPYLDVSSHVKIFQGDVYKNPLEQTQEDRWEEIYRGNVFDIPWVYLNFYLYKNESIELRNVDGKGDYALFISVVEDKKWLNAETEL